MTKPRRIILPKGHAKGVEAELFSHNDPSHAIAEGWFWTYSVKDLRRLSKWAAEVADYLDALGVKDCKR